MARNACPTCSRRRTYEPEQQALRLDEISAQVDRVATLVRVGEMAAVDRNALAELLQAISTPLDHIAGVLHEMPEAA